MTSTRRARWHNLFCVVAAVGCAGKWAADYVRNTHDKSEVARIIGKMKTVCVGRLMVDMPIEADIRIASEMIGGFAVETVEEADTKFYKRVEARQKDIEARGAATDGTGGMVEAIAFRQNDVIGQVFAYGLNRGYLMHGGRRVDNEFLSVEAHARVDDRSFVLSAQYADRKTARLAVNLLTRLRSRKEGDVPDKPGFCIKHGVFAEPLPPHLNESITMFVGLPRHPDIGLALFSIANAKPGPTLLARAAEADAAAGAAELLRTSTLRSNKRDINGIAGEELAERFRERNLTTGLMLNWETRGVQHDVRQPYISLEMQTGGGAPGGTPVDTTLHPDAVLALWDGISSTIRLRDAAPSVVSTLGRAPKSQLGNPAQ